MITPLVEFKQYFEQFGEVTEAMIMIDREFNRFCSLFSHPFFSYQIQDRAGLDLSLSPTKRV
jgi:hypothetical protein